MTLPRIDKDFPNPRILRDLEKETLDYIRKNAKFKVQFGDLQRNADNGFIYLKSLGDKLTNNLIQFEAYFDADIEGFTRRIFIGAKVILNSKKQYENYSYFFAIGESNTCPIKLLRKFHFDYIATDVSQFYRFPSPLFHLQYCGILSAYLQNEGCQNNHMDESFELPRIPAFPISLALLFHYLIKSLCKPEIANILNDNKWRKIIKKNEESLWTPYYNCCHDFINSHKTEDHLLSEYFYAKL